MMYGVEISNTSTRLYFDRLGLGDFPYRLHGKSFILHFTLQGMFRRRGAAGPVAFIKTSPNRIKFWCDSGWSLAVDSRDD